MNFLERTREGHRQSDKHWNRFKGDAGETSGAHILYIMGFSERIELSCTEQSDQNAQKVQRKH